MKRKLYSILYLMTSMVFSHAYSQSLTNSRAEGYKGIWFELGQKYEYGDKYSGALGTYTAKHIPLAIYAEKVNKTFFVYGGTTDETDRHLLCMIGEYDHATGMVKKPTVVFDKNGVDDPHDNPSITLDEEGYIWVFVSGRGTKRMGYKYKSSTPYAIDSFEQQSEEEMTYPQIFKMNEGFFHSFTKYSGVRQLYFETSANGVNWSNDQLLAAIPQNEGEKSGHYQISNTFKGEVIGTFFNRHIEGHPDKRTDIYYVQSADFGKSWTTVLGEELAIPITNKKSPAQVSDYHTLGKNIYLKDINFDAKGRPAGLFVRSNGHEPGPSSAPYEWIVVNWTGKKWKTTVVTTSDHNYDMGSLYIVGKNWKVVGPTEPGPQKWGVGGELAIWSSENKGKTWKKEKILTSNSQYSHAYVRRPVNFKAPFCFYWASGHSHEFSKSELYFGDFEGTIWRLPYDMTEEYEQPILIDK